jgi:hypothetical protein
MRSAYIAPTEFAASSTQLKRALLTFDKVYLADPGDRDLIPPQALMIAMGLPPFLGFNTGPVRTLGKVGGYDDAFDRLLNEFGDARQQGLIEVVSSYDLSTTSNQLTIGSVMMGEYPLNPQFMLSAYRGIASQPEVLTQALRGDTPLMGLSDEELSSLVPERASADGGINDSPALPPLESELAREHLREQLSSVARGRIAATMKSIGYCAAKEMVPVFENQSYERLVGVFSERASQAIDVVAEEDPYWQGRRRALNIAHEEYIDDEVLSRMPVDAVIELRSSAWGAQAEARDALLLSAAQLARDGAGAEDFEEAVRARIQDYRAQAEEVQKQRKDLSFAVNCELLKGGGGATTTVMAGATASGMLSQMQTAMGAATVLLAGCLWAIDKIKVHKPAADELRAAEAEFKDDVCFGMHNFYRRIGKAVGSNIDA